MESKTWLELSKKYLNVKYKLGSFNIDEGLDCLSFLILFYKDIGKDVIKLQEKFHHLEYKGRKITFNNYHTELKNWKEHIECFKLLLDTHFTKKEYFEKGDILIMKEKDEISISIYAGNSKVFIVSKEYGIYPQKLLLNNIIRIYNFND